MVDVLRPPGLELPASLEVTAAWPHKRTRWSHMRTSRAHEDRDALQDDETVTHGDKWAIQVRYGITRGNELSQDTPHTPGLLVRD